MNANTLYDAFAKISDSLTDTAYEAKKPERTKNFKTIAIAAAALVVAAAAIFAIPAFRSDPNNVSAVEDTSEVDDSNVLYRSENGEFVVRVVEPLDVPKVYNYLWAPITDNMLNSFSTVITGTIEKVEEIEISYSLFDQDLNAYWSLLTVSADDVIKGNGDVIKGETVSVLFELSTHSANEDNIYPLVNEKYVFFLNKTSELKNVPDYSSIADYMYEMTGDAFIPLDEPQNQRLSEILGSEDNFGEKFVEALANYYADSNGNVLYRSEDGDFVVRVVEPLENPVYINTEWAVLTDSIIRGNTDVFTGAITDITEISMTYRYMDQDVTDYLSLITAEVKDTLKGDLTKKETVTFIFPYSSRMACMEVDPEIGKEYAFYLTKTSELNHSLDYTPIAEYYYCIQGYCMTPLDEPQDNELLKIIGAEEGICGEAFVDSLKNYYSGKNENLIYRSENGDYTVWKVNPDSLSGVGSAACWVPVDDEMLHRASDVVVGTIKDITDIYIETGDHDYLETQYGVIDLSEVYRYKSLVTVEVKETINGDIAEGETITFVYESPLASYPKNISSSSWGDESAIVGRDYVFFLKKTSEKDYKFDLTPIAAYAYGIIGPCFVPYDEPQDASLLETIGAQKGTCGEEFIEAVKKYYE